jgi:hypothetical protein
MNESMIIDSKENKLKKSTFRIKAVEGTKK